jgi:hypothetical protein
MSYKYRAEKNKIDKVQLSVYFPVEWKQLLFDYAERDARSFNSLLLSITRKFLIEKGLLNEE